jgi:uncharacterized protein (TIGR04255 family)
MTKKENLNKKNILIEVICSFVFNEDFFPDFETFSFFYRKVNDLYPVYTEELLPNVNFSNSNNTFEYQLKLRKGILLYSEDKKRLLQIFPGNILINTLGYPGWDKFKSRIELIYPMILESFKYQNLKSLTLRYVNKITILDKNIDLKDHFNLYPFFNKDLLKEIKSFNLETVFT